MTPEPVLDPTYWKERMIQCRGELHRTFFNGSIDQFKPHEEQHKKILQRAITPSDLILDAGCGYGRLAGLLPCHWNGTYVGVDICPEFIAMAQVMYPPIQFMFLVGDLRKLSFPDKMFDVAVICSVRPMVIRHAGEEVWDQMSSEIDRVSKRMVYLTLGEHD